ncbi:MAG: hypothetical protein IJJ64_15200 [Butyrivibrio sp.]|nr:hypothetical protein [Butyrivibrio sp.]
MRKKIILMIMATSLLTACSSQRTAQNADVENTAVIESTEEDSVTTGADETLVPDESTKSLVVYFDYSENIDTTGMDVDAISSASLRGGSDGTNIENLKVMVDAIAERTDADVFSVQVNEVYPPDFEDMTGIARDDIANGKEFTFKNELPDLGEYDTVYVGVPVWWGELPQPMHVFFDNYDFSGKTIIPFGIHHGSRFGKMIVQVKEYEPGATVLDGFTIDADTSNEEVRAGIEEYLDSL